MWIRILLGNMGRVLTSVSALCRWWKVGGIVAVTKDRYRMVGGGQEVSSKKASWFCLDEYRHFVLPTSAVLRQTVVDRRSRVVVVVVGCQHVTRPRPLHATMSEKVKTLQPTTQNQRRRRYCHCKKHIWWACCNFLRFVWKNKRQCWWTFYTDRRNILRQIASNRKLLIKKHHLNTLDHSQVTQES